MDLILKPSNGMIKNATKNIRLTDAIAKVDKSPDSSFVSKLAKNIKTISAPVPRYFESAKQISTYAEPEYDLSSTFKLLKYEPYFLKATQKKQNLLTKSGVSIQSNDDEIREYLEARFSLMFLQTGKSIKEIVNQIAYYLIVCSNAFLIKVRDKDFQYGSSYLKDNKEMHPVVGLFPVHPTSMKPRFKSVNLAKGKYQLVIDKWIHFNARGETVQFNPDDVVHFTMLKEDGMIYGMPEVVPVIDDIRTLRKIEEDVQLLIYRDLFPIIHYTIENPVVIDPQSGWTELDKAKSDLENIIQDGGIATSNTHKIEFVGNKDKGMDVKPYLEYFQQRVFSGLGVSMSDMGLGKDISGNTASSMSKQMTDAVRFIQSEISRQFNELILFEMILQSSFGIQGLRLEVAPRLEFIETDIEWKIRNENHHADLFAKGVLDIDEARNAIGRPALKEEQLTRTHAGLYGQLETDQQLQADDHLTRLSAAVAPKETTQSKTATGGTSKKTKKASVPMPSAPKKSAADRDSVKSAKSNSNIVKSMRDSATDSISLSDQFRDTVGKAIKIEDKTKRKLNIMLATKCTYDIIKSDMQDSFYEGILDARKDIGKLEDSSEIKIMHNIFESLDRIRDDVSEKLNKDSEYINKASARISMAAKTEKTRAYNYGYAMTCVNNNRNEFIIYSNSNDVSGDSAELIGKEVILSNREMLTKIPPFRPNSRLRIKIKELSNV